MTCDSRIPRLLSRPCISRGPRGRTLRGDVGEDVRRGMVDPCDRRESGCGVEGNEAGGYASGVEDNSGKSIEKLPSEFCDACLVLGVDFPFALLLAASSSSSYLS